MVTVQVPDPVRIRAQVLQPALDAVVAQLGTVADLAGTAGAGVLEVLPHQVSAALQGTADAVGGLVDLLPALATEIDVVLAQVHAQRLSIAAVLAELNALDSQLAVLESTLTPLQGWSHQLGQVGSAVSARLRPAT